MKKADSVSVELTPTPSLHKSSLQREAWSYAETKLKGDFLTLSLSRSSIDDLVFSVFPSNFVKLSYKISLIKNGFVTLFFIRFS